MTSPVESDQNTMKYHVVYLVTVAIHLWGDKGIRAIKNPDTSPSYTLTCHPATAEDETNCSLLSEPSPDNV